MFKHLLSVEEARKILLSRCHPLAHKEQVPLGDAVGRALSKDVASQVDLPGFYRAAMDGFAVRSSDTRTASPHHPIHLRAAEFRPIRTGMPLPHGLDSVVMREDAVQRGSQLEVMAEMHPYRNVSRPGEDVSRGEVVLREGHNLRPPDLALLAALGLSGVEVYARPRVAVIPTGSELVPIGSRPLKPGEAYEINGLVSELYIKKWGGLPERQEIVPDDPELLKEAVSRRLDSELILLIGGTSVGERDYAPKVLADLGELLVHGMRASPGKPTTFGAVGSTPVICLPGYPVAAISALYLLLRPALKQLAHLNDPFPATRARLSRKIASRPGYISVVRVALEGDLAVPVMSSGAGILSSVTRAQGFVMVPEDREGIEAGEMVEVTRIE
jgi:molybdopterin molybdotransferase